MYTIISTAEGELIRRDSDGAFIPKSEDNRDYMEYLDWLSEGNIPSYE